MSASGSQVSDMISIINGKYIINGSAMEGGGQILRLATCLSVICNTCAKIVNIRGNRRPSGLRPQHLKGLELVNHMSCGRGRLRGLKVGSTEVEIIPGIIEGGHHKVDCQTAGSVTLIMQGVIPCALFAEKQLSEFVLKGGTNVNWSPSIEYMQEVFLPIAKLFGIESELTIQKRGFYPEGGGGILLKIKSVSNLSAITLIEKGNITSIWGEVFSTVNVHESVVNDIRTGALDNLKKHFPDMIINIAIGNYPSPKSAATGINLFAETSTGCRFGVCELKQQSEEPRKFGEASSSIFLKDLNSNYCVDKHLQDQLIVLMALAEGTSRVRTGTLTSHTSTAIEITSNITKAQFRIIPEGNDNIIECKGFGIKNHFLL